ncbi:MAG: membrane-binding protein [Bacteroidota bacterium]
MGFVFLMVSQQSFIFIGLIIILFNLAVSLPGYGQDTVTLYYDQAQQIPKETFQVTEEDPTILQGSYTAYYYDGSIKTKGTYQQNQPNGYWEYFYENGQPKMQGELQEGENQGEWKYFYENGRLEMKGVVNGSQRVGHWQFYYENGPLKREGSFSEGQKVGLWKDYYEDGSVKVKATYQSDTTKYQEFYTSGALKLEGSEVNGSREGSWKHYYENEKTQAIGSYQRGKRQGVWKFYYPNGQLSSVGDFMDDSSVGKWTYYYENGNISAEGAERDGVREGYWKLYHSNGDFKGEAVFNRGEGTYREFYPDGSRKVEGKLTNGVREGKWQYFYEDGTLEGEAIFTNGTGNYVGYYRDGTKKMQGAVEGGERVGVWELFQPDGQLAGYYQSVYENNEPTFKALKPSDTTASEDTTTVAVRNPDYLFRKKKSLRYFTPKINEMRYFILGINPVALLVHRLPLSLEYHIQERLGYEVEAGVFRDPFFSLDEDIEHNVPYRRGFFVNVKQKFYHNDTRSGMFYFGHQLGLDYLYHYANIAELDTEGQPIDRPQTTLLAKEQSISYSLLLGTRLMKDPDLIQPRTPKDKAGRGLTFDLYVGLGIAYRIMNSQYQPQPLYDDVMSQINQSRFHIPFYVGTTIGYVF